MAVAMDSGNLGNLLEPGPDLDALVAEKVLGYRTSWFSLHPSTDHHRLEEERPDADGDMPYRQMLKEGKWESIPPYSTYMGAAWDIVLKLRGDGMTFTLYSPDALVHDEFGIFARGGWRAEFHNWGATAPSRNGEAKRIKNAAPAVCIAALRAVNAIPDGPYEKEENEE